MRLTVIGSGPAAPQPDTPASGLLVESRNARILLDCGQGVAGALRKLLDPVGLSAVIVGHMHADHYVDLAALRYLFPWGEPAERRLPVHLPPGGRDRLAALATAISERVGFFDDAYAIAEYAEGQPLAIGDMEVSFVASRHYVPAWSMVLQADGGRIVYVGDTGPNPELAGLARGADLLVCEATLGDAAEDTPQRGHLSLDEAIGIGCDAGVGRLLVTHYPSERRSSMAQDIAGLVGLPPIDLAVPGLAIDLPALPRDARPDGRGGTYHATVDLKPTAAARNGRREPNDASSPASSPGERRAG